MDIYIPSAPAPEANRPINWTRLREEVPREDLGMICSVQNHGLAEYRVTSTSSAPVPPPAPTDFWGIIDKWGNGWMWNNLIIRGDALWLEESIIDNSLVAVTDGSYMKDTYPYLTSAALSLNARKDEGDYGGRLRNTPPTP